MKRDYLLARRERNADTARLRHGHCGVWRSAQQQFRHWPVQVVARGSRRRGRRRERARADAAGCVSDQDTVGALRRMEGRCGGDGGVAGHSCVGREVVSGFSRSVRGR